VEFQLAGANPFRYSHDAQGNEFHQEFPWPKLNDSLDFSHSENLPARQGWKLFSNEPIQAPITIQYPSRARSLSIEYSSQDELAAYWGIWINTGGWSGHKHFAVEPTTGRFDKIDRSIWDGTAGRVAASGRAEWKVMWTLG